jgi:protein-L-isoaspartate(D-aspartate) O-methyltransferase
MTSSTKSTNENLIASLVENRVLRTPLIRNAFEKIDRKAFVPEKYATEAYTDQPLPIGGGQTISQPYTVAFMLELLEPKAEQKILDVGSGSGWTTALLTYIVGSSGRVIGVELVPELVSLGRGNVAKFDLPQAEIRQAKENVLGAPADAPFDRILVSAAAENAPQELIDQLSSSGVLVMPVKNTIIRITKLPSGKTRTESVEGFAFVPLR